MLGYIPENIRMLLKSILDEVDISVPEDREVSNTYIRHNTYEILKSKNSYEIDFDKLYKTIPFLEMIEKYYDVDLPTQFPIGTINDDIIEISYMMKAITYNFIITCYYGEIVWDFGSPDIYIPSNYKKQ